MTEKDKTVKTGLENEKILIVEDQRMPRENMERMIAESGRYESAGSISDAGLALARCCRIPVDLILMDVCTAGNRDGIEAAAEIKAKFPNIKIIIVTSMAEVGFWTGQKRQVRTVSGTRI